MSSSTPHIHRPIPRRPFGNDDAADEPPSPLLNARPFDEPPPSRTGSILNLTSSTLLGIYSPTGYSASDYGEPSTPWGTGTQTPLNGPEMRRKLHTPPPPPPPSTFYTIFSLAIRTILLFGMGMGYGALVRHLHDERQLAPFQVESIIKPRSDWTYFAFWGMAGAASGSLLPWIDTLFPAESEEAAEGAGKDSPVSKKTTASGEELGGNGLPGADWTPVIRSVGAFVGIAYAIRKLPWSSTLQASLTLALVNPVLWYLIDRSKPGFILSSAVGATGTALLLATTPDIMPTPLLTSTTFPHAHHNTSTTPPPLLRDIHLLGLDLGGLISRERVEGAIWILSVLFCSCVCFGNIGRRLALSDFGMRRDVGRGRGLGFERSRRNSFFHDGNANVEGEEGEGVFMR